MERDPTVYCMGEDVAAAGGVFKATVGSFDKFGARSRYADLGAGDCRSGAGRRHDSAEGLAAAAELESSGIDSAVVDVRSLAPLGTRTILAGVSKTGRLFAVEENPRLCGWGAEIASIAAKECFDDLDGPMVRITTPHVARPAAQPMEEQAMPTRTRMVEPVKGAMR